MTMSFADRCECGYETDLPPVEPCLVIPGPGPIAVTAYYRCPVCGRKWRTGWMPDISDEVLAMARQLAGKAS